MSWDNMVNWILRYWIGGMIVLLFIDGMNYLMSKTQENRFNNMERLWVFLLWPLMITVWIYSFIKAGKNKNK